MLSIFVWDFFCDLCTSRKGNNPHGTTFYSQKFPSRQKGSTIEKVLDGAQSETVECVDIFGHQRGWGKVWCRRSKERAGLLKILQLALKHCAQNFDVYSVIIVRTNGFGDSHARRRGPYWPMLSEVGTTYSGFPGFVHGWIRFTRLQLNVPAVIVTRLPTVNAKNRRQFQNAVEAKKDLPA